MRRRTVIALALMAQAGVGGCAEGRADQAEARPQALMLGPPLADGALRDLARAHDVGPLDEVPVPRPSNLEDFVRDEEAAIVLGKALFWDQQVGSDGQACASCHFHAGADDRVKNQLTSGLNRVDDPSRDPDPDTTFGDEDGRTGSGRVAGPNYTLIARDYPFHRLEDANDRNSCIDGEDDDGDGLTDFDDPDCSDTNDATSSQGTFAGQFVATGDFFDVCEDASDPTFQVGGVSLRKVEPRNTPTMINAVFNHRNFWDGRASDVFNGLNPFGERGLLPTADNPNPGTLFARNGVVVKEQVRIDNASLASQAVGPPLNDNEMSCTGRDFADLGRKLLWREPLAFQEVDEDDSVLGELVDGDGMGLDTRYRDLVAAAFRPALWVGEGQFDANGDPTVQGYTQAEVNFPLFFGLAVQLYEATLVADETDLDAFLAGDDHALSEVEQFGLQVFLEDGHCVSCHAGPELTAASVRLRANEPFGDEQAIERMVMGDGGVALYDGGFYNIGVTPTALDLGVGAEILGFPLAFARQASEERVVDDFAFHEEQPEGVPGPLVPGERVAVDGAFKVPGLRNVELTGPYFHNGGKATLRQVVDFYDRGGDRLDTEDGCDTTRFADECSNLDADIEPLGLEGIVREIDGVEVNAAEALVELLVALTDDRVEDQAAPFDHPQLLVPNGHVGNQLVVASRPNGEGITRFREIEATDEDGRGNLDPFLGLDPQQP